MKPLVSICCTTYNHASYLKHTLKSFLSQKTTFSFEILIHDDCSTDGTIEIIKEFVNKYPSIIKPLFETVNQYSQNIPINETFNFPRATGKYIALCEGDDYWIDENKLQSQIDYMENHTDCTFCFTNGIIKDQSNKLDDRAFIPYYPNEKKYYYTENHKYNMGEIIGLTFIPTATFVFPTNMYRSLPSDFHDKMCPYGDLRFKLFFTASGYAYYLDKFTCVYRENVPNSALFLWGKDDKKRVFKRSKDTLEMLHDVDRYSNYNYTEQINDYMNIHCKNMLLNADNFDVFKSIDCKRTFNSLSFIEKIKVYLKIIIPDNIFFSLSKLKNRNINNNI